MRCRFTVYISISFSNKMFLIPAICDLCLWNKQFCLCPVQHKEWQLGGRPAVCLFVVWIIFPLSCHTSQQVPRCTDAVFLAGEARPPTAARIHGMLLQTAESVTGTCYFTTHSVRLWTSTLAAQVLLVLTCVCYVLWRTCTVTHSHAPQCLSRTRRRNWNMSVQMFRLHWRPLWSPGVFGHDTWPSHTWVLLDI